MFLTQFVWVKYSEKSHLTASTKSVPITIRLLHCTVRRQRAVWQCGPLKHKGCLYANPGYDTRQAPSVRLERNPIAGPFYQPRYSTRTDKGIASSK
jgi:hypothetical protein